MDLYYRPSSMLRGGGRKKKGRKKKEDDPSFSFRELTSGFVPRLESGLSQNPPKILSCRSYSRVQGVKHTIYSKSHEEPKGGREPGYTSKDSDHWTQLRSELCLFSGVFPHLRLPFWYFPVDYLFEKMEHIYLQMTSFMSINWIACIIYIVSFK